MAASEQIDLFLDSMIDAPLRDEQATLEHPFFSLTKRPQREPMIYDHGAISIQVSPGPRGIATIWDRDVLIYCASILNDRLGRGLPLERKIRFAAHDFLKLTGRGKGLQAYTLFLDALERLNTTSVKTTIAAGDSTERRGFTWISAWRVIEDTRPDGTRRMRGVEVELCDWMYRAIVQDRRVLSINPQYFRLHSGLARRLYQLARKHCGRQPNWSIGLVRLAEKVGTAQDLRFFKRDLKAIIAKDGVPDYTFTMTRDPNGELEAAMAEQGIDMSDLKNDRILVVVTPKFETSHQGGGFHIPQANTIAYRPDVINERQRLGDWECDLVQFRKEFGNANLTTIVERKTRLLVIVRNQSRHSQGVMKGIKSKLGPYPAQARRSITFDRGSEFANYSYLKSEIGAEGFFCKPQAPWQKGTNENTNGRMRRFLPRETDLATVTDAQLQAIADKMNATPRKCLGFIAPNEAFSRLLTVENAS